MDYAQLRNVNCQGSVKITDVESFVSTALKLTRKKTGNRGVFIRRGLSVTYPYQFPAIEYLI